MDLAPKQLQSQDVSILKSTAEARLKNFMQDVTGRALVMMESATKVSMVLPWIWFRKPSFPCINPMQKRRLKNGIRFLYYPEQQVTGLASQRGTTWSNVFIFQKVSLDDDEIEVDDIVDESTPTPLEFLNQAVTAEEIQEAIAKLPVRQQQAFMLRAWEGFDTHTTAQIMNCTEGSVKPIITVPFKAYVPI